MTPFLLWWWSLPDPLTVAIPVALLIGVAIWLVRCFVSEVRK